jgi:hypothetical protein
MNTRTTIEKHAQSDDLLVSISDLIEGNGEHIDFTVLIKNDPTLTLHTAQRKAVARAQQLLTAWLQAAH